MDRRPIVYSRELDRAVAEADPKDLIMSNLDQATRVALWFWRTQSKAIPLEELQAECLLTLVEVVREGRTDEIRNFKKYVMQAMHRALFTMVQEQSGAGIHQGKFQDVGRLRKIENVDAMTDAEICQELGWEQRRLRSTRQALAVLSGQVTLDQPVGDDEEQTIKDIIPDPEPGPEETVLDKLEKEEARRELVEAISELTPAMQRAVSLRFGVPVPGLEKMALRDVVALSHNRSITSRGIRELRKGALGGGVVPSGSGSPFGGIRGGDGPAGGTRESVALEKWRRYSSDPSKWPPALQSTGAVGY